MKPKKMVEYCSLSPPFPQVGYMLYHFLTDERGIFGVYPMTTLYTSIDEARQDINLVASEWEKRGVIVPESCVLITANLIRMYRNEKRFWEEPNQHYDVSARMTSFLPVANNPQFYKLLVTASLFDDDRKWEFRAALPMYVNADEKLIELFMLHSDHPVDERSKYSAIYTFNEAQRLNRVSGELTKITSQEEPTIFN